MGELIFFAERAADRSRPSSGDAFFFSLDCPISYLVGERVERVLGEIGWIPVLGPLSEPAALGTQGRRTLLGATRFEHATAEAAHLHLPLVEPARFPADVRGASRIAAFAAERGRASAFARAAARLAFCGGFDLGRNSVLGEAAAAAGLPPDEALAAARDTRYDLQLDMTSRGLLVRGASSPPAIRIGGRWFEGVGAVLAAADHQARRLAHGSPSAPVS